MIQAHVKKKKTNTKGSHREARIHTLRLKKQTCKQVEGYFTVRIHIDQVAANRVKNTAIEFKFTAQLTKDNKLKPKETSIYHDKDIN